MSWLLGAFVVVVVVAAAAVVVAVVVTEVGFGVEKDVLFIAFMAFSRSGVMAGVWVAA